MANEVQDNSMVAPKTEEPQASSGEVTISHDLPMSVHGAGEPSTLIYDGDDEKKLQDDIEEDHPNTLEYADVLMAKGSTALDEKDFFEAAECFSRALEIRVANFGELDKDRFNAYYFYGYALLRHVLDDGTTQVSNEGGTTQAESTCVSSDVENDESSDADDSETGLNEEENDEIEIDTDDTSNNDEDEDENELDLAWQILDFARVISETRPTQSMSNVYILCALGEVNCYREDLKTSLEDYLKASQILESLVEPNLMDRASLYPLY
ncbi:protein NASP homolog 1-like [Impatiens glandulifera]|uniref:protein NASP homolog 1-like n=1 Tax=Impatiens glandulifera TaxID=253017 RepID=UPI001FB130CF|nr:protein NASP homolog 1-like [Impatiens glandulifera]